MHSFTVTVKHVPYDKLGEYEQRRRIDYLRDRAILCVKQRTKCECLTTYIDYQYGRISELKKDRKINGAKMKEEFFINQITAEADMIENETDFERFKRYCADIETRKEF